MSEELDTLRETIAATLADRFDRRALHGFADGAAGPATRLWDEAAAQGWLAIGVAEPAGGLALGAPGLAMLHRELGRVLAPGAFIATLVAAQCLSDLADDAIDDRIGAIIAGGERIAVAVGPVEAGRIIKDSNGISATRLRMLGEQTADWLLLPLDEGDVVLLDASGIETGLVAMWDPTRTLFDATFADAPILYRSSGGTAASRLAQHVALAVAADSIGGARAILDQTVEYLGTRQQFGQPIGAFQALKHRAADMAAMLAINELLVDEAIEAVASAVQPDLWAPLAKAGAADAYAHIAGDCLQLHGGIGFTWEHDCHLFLKRARLNQVLGGTSAQARDGAARALAASVAEGCDA